MVVLVYVAMTEFHFGRIIILGIDWKSRASIRQLSTCPQDSDLFNELIHSSCPSPTILIITHIKAVFGYLERILPSHHTFWSIIALPYVSEPNVAFECLAVLKRKKHPTIWWDPVGHWWAHLAMSPNGIQNNKQET